MVRDGEKICTASFENKQGLIGVIVAEGYE